MLENNNIQAGLANVNAKAEIKTDIKGEMKVLLRHMMLERRY